MPKDPPYSFVNVQSPKLDIPPQDSYFTVVVFPKVLWLALGLTLLTVPDILSP